MNDPDKHRLGWYFLDEKGTFALRNPHQTSALYFPLVNEAGLISSITPMLHGDIKTGQNSFLTTPVSIEDLHNSRSARNFWVLPEGDTPWSVSGISAPQIMQRFDEHSPEQVELQAGLLWHKLIRENRRVGLRAETVNFVPANEDQVELMQVTLTNVTDRPLTLTPTAAIPIYGRSADNLRDHRHVTSLLHRIFTHTHGVLVRPTLSFDERGHTPNSVTYGVLGTTAEGGPPVGFYPVLEDFIGEGGNLEWPLAVVQSCCEYVSAGEAFAGYEAIGALRFDTLILAPGASQSYLIIMAVMKASAAADELIDRYGSQVKFDKWLQHTQDYWQRKLATLEFRTADARFDRWMKWVGLQPILRLLCGNSFLPYHDYGRGGRGWRDLWQDSLTLLMMEPEGVADLLWSYYAGVRIDGSNATIIGAEPGEFRADRNDIPRVWMDHGAWPFLATRLYIDQTGDIAFLLRNQTYFKDQHTRRCQAHDEAWKPSQGLQLRTHNGQVYEGSILEHLLAQHLTAFFNVGQHNNIKLEGADWNDGMDMAAENGESVAFTALYASNLRQLGQLVRDLDGQGITEIELASELFLLLDTLDHPVSYHSVAAKNDRLAEYFDLSQHTISGKKRPVTIVMLADDLTAKAEWLYQHLSAQEWIQEDQEHGWFNGYYDNNGRPVEGLHRGGVRMTLTGQVFTLMGGIATPEQARQMVSAAERYLLDPAVGGYRLNSDFQDVRLDLGRCFGYAFGHKENGAMFSHMAIMWANALYQRDMIGQGYNVVDGIYQHCASFDASRIYPGIPEYISDRGRGMYPYLTGSASWLLLTMLTQVFGVRGHLGDLYLEPKLMRSQFDAKGRASVFTLFAGRRLNLIYHNHARLEHGAYQIEQVSIDGQRITIEHHDQAVAIARMRLSNLAADQTHQIDIVLAPSAK